MIEKGRFYRAGLMKDIDPGHPNSTVPYFIKVQEGDAIPEGAIVEEGEFAIAVVCAGFDPKTKEPTGTKRYYVKATEDVKRQVEKNYDDFAQSLARHLIRKTREYQAQGLEYFEEIRKQVKQETKGK